MKREYAYYDFTARLASWKEGSLYKHRNDGSLQINTENTSSRTSQILGANEECLSLMNLDSQLKGKTER